MVGQDAGRIEPGFGILESFKAISSITKGIISQGVLDAFIVLDSEHGTRYTRRTGFNSTPSKSTISFTAPNHKRSSQGNYLLNSFNRHGLAAPSDAHAMNGSGSEFTA
jgi:hypothetical protein